MIFSNNFTDILHPISVHFPVALGIVGAFLSIIFLIWEKDPALNWCCKILLWLATLGAIAAFITSNFTPNMTGEANDVENMHHNFAVLTLISFCISSLIYLFTSFSKKHIGKAWDWIAFIFYMLGAIFVGITGYYGGYIIYNVLL